MFSSLWSAPADPTAPNLFPVTANLGPEDLYAELQPEDLNWTCPGGFATETQIWYQILDDGTFLMCQIIHSSAGMWYPTIQFVCKVFNPVTKVNIWKSVNVTNFVTPATGSDDKRSSKSDQFTVKFKTGAEGETYAITGNLAEDLQLNLDVLRPAGVAGFKIGKGPQGGFSYFGPDIKNPEGYVVHRFWPRTNCSGHIIHKGQALAVNGTGAFIHAIQGMRPDYIAARWNFMTFQSEEHGGVAAIQMEFTTTSAYGKSGAGSGGVVVNVGGLVVGGKLIAVTGETKWPGDVPAEDAHVKSRAIHYDTQYDAETGYDQPSRVGYIFSGPSLANPKDIVNAFIEVDVGGPHTPKGLMDKIDILAELPYALKLVVNYVAGTKPYIYQWLNPASLTINLPSSNPADEPLIVKGNVFNEASFVS